MDKPAAMVREMERIGRPGANYLIRMPGAVSARFQKLFAHKSYFAMPNHVRIIEPRELEDLAESRGLHIGGRGQWGFYRLLWRHFFWASQRESGDDATAMDRIRPSYHPLPQSGTETWTRLPEPLKTDGLRRAPNELMPKSRVIVTRRK